MSKSSIDYNNTIIYKIISNNPDITECYVGHTTKFIQRKRKHKECCNNEKSKSYNYNVYKFIRENGGWDNWTMVEIEEYPCADMNEACSRERYWYENLNAKLNKNVPNRKWEEYSLEYRTINKEVINAYKSQKSICECGCSISNRHMARHRKSPKHQLLLNQSIP
jgi:hypothetical protein